MSSVHSVLACLLAVITFVACDTPRKPATQIGKNAPARIAVHQARDSQVPQPREMETLRIGIGAPPAAGMLG